MSYDSNVLALSPKHYWKMDETSGTVCTDYGSTPTNGVYAGSPSLNQAALSVPSGAPGSTISSGPTMNLDAVDDKMTVATNPNYTSMTACMWVKAGSTTDGYWFTWTWSSGSLPINIGGGNGGFGTASKWSVGTFSGSAWYFVDGSSLVNGQETFIVATMTSGGFLRMWQDGKYKGQTALPSIPAYSSAGGLRIGQRWDGGQIAGRVSGLALWDSVLSDSQIQSLVPPQQYSEQTNILENTIAPNPTPFKPFNEQGSSGGGGGGGGVIPTTGQLWPRGNW